MEIEVTSLVFFWNVSLRYLFFDPHLTTNPIKFRSSIKKGYQMTPAYLIAYSMYDGPHFERPRICSMRHCVGFKCSFSRWILNYYVFLPRHAPFFQKQEARAIETYSKNPPTYKLLFIFVTSRNTCTISVIKRQVIMCIRKFFLTFIYSH